MNGGLQRDSPRSRQNIIMIKRVLVAVIFCLSFYGVEEGTAAGENPGVSTDGAREVALPHPAPPSPFVFLDGRDFIPPLTPSPAQDGEDEGVARSRLSGRFTQEAMKSLQQGNVEAARQLFGQALSLAPNNSLAYSFLAQIYFREGKENQALRMLEQAGRYSTYGELVYGFLEYFLPFFKEQFSPPVYPRVSLATFKDNKDSAVCFTFDDGTRSVLTLVLPIFDEFSYKATILVNPETTTEKPANPWWGSWQEWQEAARRGHEIGSHSFHHWDLTLISEDLLHKEIGESFSVIKAKIGVPPLSFAFPFDHAHAPSIKKVQEYYSAIRERTTLEQIYPHVFLPVYGGDKFPAAIGRRIIDLVVVKRLWMVAECHAAKTEEVMTFKPITTEFLRDHLSYIKEREGEIWVGTFAEQQRYLSARQSARLVVLKDHPHKVIFKLDTSLQKADTGQPLTVVINPVPDKPSEVRAYARAAKKRIAAKIVGGLVLVDVAPGSGPVEVRWE